MVNYLSQIFFVYLSVNDYMAFFPTSATEFIIDGRNGTCRSSGCTLGWGTRLEEQMRIGLDGLIKRDRSWE